jgi:hypothetical protein
MAGADPPAVERPSVPSARQQVTHAAPPGWRVIDRATITHAVKRQNRLLEADGRVRRF